MDTKHISCCSITKLIYVGILWNFQHLSLSPSLEGIDCLALVFEPKSFKLDLGSDSVIKTVLLIFRLLIVAISRAYGRIPTMLFSELQGNVQDTLVLVEKHSKLHHILEDARCINTGLMSHWKDYENLLFV